MDPEEMRAALTAAVQELEAHDEEEDGMEEVAATQEQASGGDKQQGTSKVTRTLQMILEELRLMREDRAKDRAEVNELRQEVQCLKAVVTQQQRFAEQLDAYERQCNLIITGVPEGRESMDGATDDKTKCEKIMEAIGTPGVIIDMRRLGNAQEGKKRPILVKTPCREARDTVLQNTKALKDAGGTYRHVYVKKDIHPAVRKEWRRLKDAEKSEKEKPCNQGCDIRLDTNKRELLRDGVIIDRWSPSFFVQTGPNNWTSVHLIFTDWDVN